MTRTKITGVCTGALVLTIMATLGRAGRTPNPTTTQRSPGMRTKKKSSACSQLGAGA